MTNAAYKGAAMNQALANAHAAAFDGKEIGSDSKHKHHHHHHLSDSENYHEDDQDNGVVYKHGKKGYYDANGEFIQYAQSAHKPVNHDAAFKQVSAESDAVINGTIGDGSEFLLGQGWKPNNGKWHKKGYTLTLVVENGIVLNAQLSK
ncbi:hypothetical protein C2U54_20090 [Leclercia sp. LSNIH1]|nr:hypothetical protein C2U54_20090 [Leclercia sp. LSNIH1]POV36465.1 hypothetical protein C3388_04110 [Leclercia sp. LSNIH5]POW68591.1 hypothetical protein C3389_02335 [Leclercia sp. LSNIH2]